MSKITEAIHFFNGMLGGCDDESSVLPEQVKCAIDALKTVERLNQKLNQFKLSRDLALLQGGARSRFHKEMLDNIILAFESIYENDLSGWFPVSKSLPNHLGEMYEVTKKMVIDGRTEYITNYAVYGTDEKWHCDSEVVAWRYITRPYIPKEENYELSTVEKEL